MYPQVMAFLQLQPFRIIGSYFPNERLEMKLSNGAVRAWRTAGPMPATVIGRRYETARDFFAVSWERIAWRPASTSKLRAGMCLSSSNRKSWGRPGIRVLIHITNYLVKSFGGSLGEVKRQFLFFQTKRTNFLWQSYLPAVHTNDNLETRVLDPLENPFGPKVLPM